METNKLAIVEKYCKGCDICVAFCPKDCLKVNNRTGKVEIVDNDACILCGQCEMRCPDFAIYLKGGKNE